MSILAIILLGFAAGAYILYARRPLYVRDIPITVKSTRATESSKTHRMVVDLPAVDGLADSEEQMAINAAMRQPILDAMERFKTQAFADRPDLEDGTQYEFLSSFSVEHFTDRILSIKFTHSEYTGGAHPLGYTTTYNYDFNAHAEITLLDIINRDKGLTLLAQLVRAQAMKKLKLVDSKSDALEVKWVNRGTKADLQNYDMFILGKHAITIFFDPTEIAPQAAGIVSIAIPYTDLREQIVQGSVIEEYL